MIATARAQLVTLLATVAPTHPAWPAPLALPCVVLTEADPFVTEGATFGEVALQFEALLMVRPGSPTAMVDQLDQLTAATLTAIAGEYEWSAGGYSTLTTPDGQSILTARVTITTTKETP